MSGATIGVIGAGAFGTALAVSCAAAGHDVRLWGRNPETMRAAGRDRRIARLEGVTLPSEITCISALADLAGCEALLLALPAQQTRTFLEREAKTLGAIPLVLCAKGIDAATFQLQTGIAGEAAPGHPLAVLTGPGFAGEIARGLPTALTLACADARLGNMLQHLLSGPRLRLYLTDDVTGVQVGGALKNVIAIACGMAEGARLGASARAAVMTRGFAEMTRLGVAIGARAETLAGLSGLGDLSLTCNSMQSRNFARGLAIGRGEAAPDATVEGVATARAACTLAAQHGVDMPIAAAVADVLDGRLTLTAAMDALFSRPLKEE